MLFQPDDEPEYSLLSELNPGDMARLESTQYASHKQVVYVKILNHGRIKVKYEPVGGGKRETLVYARDQRVHRRYPACKHAQQVSIDDWFVCTRCGKRIVQFLET